MPRVGASGHELTPEQQRIIALPPNRTRKWLAFAGCAKTTTAEEYTRFHPEPALYLAFNNSIAREAKGRFPSHVHTQTAHGYAYSRMDVQRYSSRLIRGRLRPEHLDPCRDRIRTMGSMTDVAVRRAILKSIDAFLISDASRITAAHMTGFPIAFRQAALSMVQAVCDRLLSFEDSGMTFNDDVYLKAFQLRGSIDPRFRYLILDEAQDLNPVLIAIAKGSGLPCVIVGDPHQCLMPGQPVDVPGGQAMIESIRPDDLVMAACGRGRMVPARVVRVHAKRFAGKMVTITTESGRVLTTTPEHTHFAGYAGTGWQEGHSVYLQYRSDLGWRIGTACDYKSQDGENRKGFIGRAVHEGAEAAFLLRSQLDPKDASILEAVWSLKYGIPSTTFVARKPRDPEYVRAIFDQVDGREGAARLLADLHMDPSCPHYRPKCSFKNRINFTVTLAGGTPNLHRYAISGSEDEDRLALEVAGIKTRKAKTAKGWRIESATANLAEVYALHDRVKAVLPGVLLREQGNYMEGRSLPFVTAANCKPGMSIFTRCQETGTILRDSIVSVDRFDYDGIVHDIDVERYHNYVAAGIVTHNSIYRFRGAEQAMDHFQGETLTLTRSFRFGPRIAKVANYILRQSKNPPTELIEGTPDKDTKVNLYPGSVKGRATMLSRTNMRLFESLVQIPSTFHVIGGVSDMLDLVEAGWHKWRDSVGRPAPGRAPKNQRVDRHRTWADLVDASEHDEEPELVRLVKIVDTYQDKVPEILADLRERSMPTEEEARFVVSTAHKAKGREWDVVILMDDFAPPSQLRAMLAKRRFTPEEYNQEINLLYVAATRAIRHLQVSSPLFDEIAAGTGLPLY